MLYLVRNSVFPGGKGLNQESSSGGIESSTYDDFLQINEAK